MAEAATRRMSAVRERHAAHPVKARPASKPGTPSSANAPRRGSSNPSDRRRSGGDGGREISAPNGKEISLPGGKETSLPGGKDLSVPSPHLPVWTRLALKIAKRLLKHEWRVNVADLRPSLPIQQSVEIGVPLEFAWQKWMELSFLPEGVDKVVDIERSGDGLSGHLADGSGDSWSAEILDERECESFAWRSTGGSDCAGLVTFHRLSDRLTRIELSLDVVPLSATDSASLLTHLADWRARKELRRFKAELEVISPDVYADDEGSSSR